MTMKGISYVYHMQYPISSHEFVTMPKKSNTDLISIINDITNTLPDFNKFINQFHSLISEKSINVITDASGNMSIDVPNSMSDNEANLLSTRVRIIDSLVRTKEESLHDLFTRAEQLQKSSNCDTSLKSQVNERLSEFKKLKDSYKH